MMTARRIQAWGVLFLVLICLPALSHEPYARAAGRAEIGINVDLMNGDVATVRREFDLVAAMNVTWVRVDFDWSAIENHRGNFNWAYADQIVNEATARRMKVVAVLAYTPYWARPPGTTSHAPPEEASPYAEFARAAAARYTPLGVRTWEIWNEPNSSDFWQPRPDAKKYGELFQAAAAAVRGVDPSATLLTGGLTRGTDTPDGARVSQITYVEQLYTNGTAQLADAIAVHPYSFPSLPMDANQSVVGGFKDLPALHDLMNRHGDGGKKIWITEFGAPTGTGAGAVPEGDQAAAVVEARRQVQSWNWCGPIIYYELRDSGTDLTEIEDNFGVLRRDFSAKPAGGALMLLWWI